MQTATRANGNIMMGGKLYQRRARLVLPLLVRQAKAGKEIYYSKLAPEVNMPNPRNLNYVLGAIGNALVELGRRTGRQIPVLNCIVLNKTNGLPGNGVSVFITKAEYSKLTRTQKLNVVQKALMDIYTYPNWDWVLNELGLEPAIGLTPEDLDGAGRTGGSGESEEHRTFKDYIARHPEVLGLSGVGKGITEVILPSADRLDVIFEQGELLIAVEVKSDKSNCLDIVRGLFQCVKYKSLIEAKQAVENKYPNSRVILALQGTFPTNLNLTRNILGIEVMDNLRTTKV
jgi:hypothetical protein